MPHQNEIKPTIYRGQLPTSATCPGSLYTCDFHDDIQNVVQKRTALMPGQMDLISNQTSSYHPLPIINHPNFTVCQKSFCGAVSTFVLENMISCFINIRALNSHILLSVITF